MPSSEAPPPVRIGISAALTGPNSASYAPTYEAINLYFQQLNDRAGAAGRRVQLLVEDDGADPTRASANATKLLQQERVPLLVLASTSATYGSVISPAGQPAHPC
jgi:ABC-type branched-subunit amino acid transport system substrate-binding protein